MNMSFLSRSFFARFVFLCLLPIVLLLPAQAADISRCLQADGTPQFTNQPCPDGVQAEPLTLVENTPLDSRTVRTRLQRAEKPVARKSRAGSQVVLIADNYTAERNGRVGGKPLKKKKTGQKKKKTSKKADGKKTGSQPAVPSP